MNHITNKLNGIAGLLLLVAFTACSSGKQVTAQGTPQEITQAINNDRWDFIADRALPSYGSSKNLTGVDFVKCRKDTLIVALPYYGKLNSTAGAMSGNPLDFTTTKFTLTKEEKKGGGWMITIKSPNSEVQSMDFTFYDNGSAQANLIMTNRSGISYSGKIVPGR
jgi:hypothetical protein